MQMANLPDSPFSPMAQGMRGLADVLDRLMGIDRIERKADEIVAEEEEEYYFPEPTAPEIR
jgi:hypothetical protein